MDYKLSIKEEVKSHIIQGYLWYEEKSTGLGSEFVQKIESTLEYLKHNPLLFQIKTDNRFREVVIQTFPYVLVYELIDKEIIVYALFPTKSNPKNRL